MVAVDYRMHGRKLVKMNKRARSVWYRRVSWEGRLPSGGIASGQAARHWVFIDPDGHALLLRLAQAKAHGGLRERSTGIGAFDWSGVNHGSGVEDAPRHPVHKRYL